MNPIGTYESKVSKFPKTFIVILVVITIFLSFFASQMQMNASEGDFQPDTEIAKANSMIRDEYGSEHNRVSLVSVADGNVLERDSLLMLVDLEEKINESETISPALSKTADAPTGVSSPARLIGQASFIQEVNETLRNMMENGAPPTGNQGGAPPDIEQIQKELRTKAQKLTVEDIRTILEGGNLTIYVEELGTSFPLNFDQYKPQDLDDLYEMELFPLDEILPILLSKDYDKENQEAKKSLTSIYIDGELEEDRALEVEKAIKNAAGEAEGEGTELRVSGDAIIDEKVNEASGRNIALLMPLAFVFVIVVLAVMYRSLTDTVLNLLSLIMAIIWVYGIGVLLNLNLGNPMMTTVPVLIIGLGIDYGIHFTSRYREELREGKGISEAVSKTGATVGFAISLTTITTVVGFSSNLISNIETIRHFGMLTSIGIGSAFVLMLTFFPAAKTVLDKRRKRKDKKVVKEKNKDDEEDKDDKKSIGDRFWSKIGEPETFCEADRDCVNNGLGLGAIAARTPIPVIIIVLLITTTGLYGGIQLEADYDFTDFLPEDIEETETVNMIVNDFNFSEETVYILVEGDVARPDVFQNIERVQGRAMNSKYAVNARRPETPYTLGESMAGGEGFEKGENEARQEFQQIWTNITTKEEIDQENVTRAYEMMMEYREDDARRVLQEGDDGEFSGILLRIPVDTQEEEKALETQKDMEEAAQPFEESDLDRVIVTGGPIVSQSIFESINEGQLQSLAITFIIALIILMLLYSYLGQGPLLGAVTILPLVFVISWTFGAMYFFNIPLNPVTVTIAAITVGLGIDFSIHLTERFVEDSKRIAHPECAMCVSTSHTGSALFGSAATTIVGFGILSLAIIPPLAQFGQVSALSIFFAFLAAVFVLPTFLLLWYKYKH